MQVLSLLGRCGTHLLESFDLAFEIFQDSLGLALSQLCAINLVKDRARVTNKCSLVTKLLQKFGKCLLLHSLLQIFSFVLLLENSHEVLSAAYSRLTDGAKLIVTVERILHRDVLD